MKTLKIYSNLKLKRPTNYTNKPCQQSVDIEDHICMMSEIQDIDAQYPMNQV